MKSPSFPPSGSWPVPILVFWCSLPAIVFKPIQDCVHISLLLSPLCLKSLNFNNGKAGGGISYQALHMDCHLILRAVLWSLFDR